MSYTHEKLDLIVDYVLRSYFLYAKKHDKSICLGHFDRHDKQHLALYYIAKSAADIFGYKIYTDMNFVNAFLFKLKHKAFGKIHHKPIDDQTIICDNLINFVEKEFNVKEIFYYIYTNYYTK